HRRQVERSTGEHPNPELSDRPRGHLGVPPVQDQDAVAVLHDPDGVEVSADVSSSGRLHLLGTVATRAGRVLGLRRLSKDGPMTMYDSLGNAGTPRRVDNQDWIVR